MSFLRAGQWGPEALIDARGTPQPGAKLTLYEADGLTLATRWIDAAKSAAAGNPWAADGSGNAVLFAEPGPHVLVVMIGVVQTQIDIMVPIDPQEAQTDVDTDVAEEAALRAAADAVLAAEITTETTRALAAEATKATTTALTAETNRATAAEATKVDTVGGTYATPQPGRTASGPSLLPFFNPLDYGAKWDVQVAQDAAMTAGSAVLTSPSGRFTAAHVGKVAQVLGAGTDAAATTVHAASAGIDVATLNAGVQTTGTTSAGTPPTSTTLTDSGSPGWTVNQWVGYVVAVATSSTVFVVGVITANTASAVTVNGWYKADLVQPTAPLGGLAYSILGAKRVQVANAVQLNGQGGQVTVATSAGTATVAYKRLTKNNDGTGSLNGATLVSGTGKLTNAGAVTAPSAYVSVWTKIAFLSQSQPTNTLATLNVAAADKFPAAGTVMVRTDDPAYLPGLGGGTLPTITAIATDGTNWTLTFSSAHGLIAGTVLTLSGFTPSGYNGTFTVATAPTTTTLTIANATSPGAVTVTGTSVSVGTLNSGTAYTAMLISGNGLPIAVANGDQLLLYDGLGHTQAVTVNNVAGYAAGATAIAINSVTPTATFAAVAGVTATQPPAIIDNLNWTTNGIAAVDYTSTAATTFAGCTPRGWGTLVAGNNVNDNLGTKTTVDFASDGINVYSFQGAGVLALVSTAGLAASGNVVAWTDIGPAVIAYTAISGSTLTGCTSKPGGVLRINDSVAMVRPSGGTLISTIASYQSPTQVTLADVAGFAVTAAEVRWGTDDTADIMLTIAAALAAGGEVRMPPGAGFAQGLTNTGAPIHGGGKGITKLYQSAKGGTVSLLEYTAGSPDVTGISLIGCNPGSPASNGAPWRDTSYALRVDYGCVGGTIDVEVSGTTSAGVWIGAAGEGHVSAYVHDTSADGLDIFGHACGWVIDARLERVGDDAVAFVGQAPTNLYSGGGGRDSASRIVAEDNYGRALVVQSFDQVAVGQVTAVGQAASGIFVGKFSSNPGSVRCVIGMATLRLTGQHLLFQISAGVGIQSDSTSAMCQVLGAIIDHPGGRGVDMSGHGHKVQGVHVRRAGDFGLVVDGDAQEWADCSAELCARSGYIVNGSFRNPHGRDITCKNNNQQQSGWNNFDMPNSAIVPVLATPISVDLFSYTAHHINLPGTAISPSVTNPVYLGGPTLANAINWGSSSGSSNMIGSAVRSYYKQTSASASPSATLNTNGSAVTLSPVAGTVGIRPELVFLTTATVGTETVTATITATHSDGTTTTTTLTATTSTNVAGNAVNLASLVKTATYVTGLSMVVKSSINNSTATATFTIGGASLS